MLTDDQAESTALKLASHPNYRVVLRRLVPVAAFAEPDGRPFVRG